MDFDFTDEQREIKSTAREFLSSRFKPERVRELAESDSPYGEESGTRSASSAGPGSRSTRSTAARGSARSS